MVKNTVAYWNKEIIMAALFAGKAGTNLCGPSYWSNGRLLALPANISLGWKIITVKKTL
jgi:hypothetical protein